MNTKQLLYPLFFIFILGMVSAETTCSQINAGFGEGGFGEGGMSTGSESCVTTTPAASESSGGGRGIGQVVSKDVMTKLSQNNVIAKDIWMPSSISDGTVHKITDPNIPLRKVTFHMNGESTFPTWQVIVQKTNVDPKVYSIFTVDAKIENLESVDIELAISREWLNQQKNWGVYKDGEFIDVVFKDFGEGAYSETIGFNTYTYTLTSFSEFIIKATEEKIETTVVPPVEPVTQPIEVAPIETQSITPTTETVTEPENETSFLKVLLFVTALIAVVGVMVYIQYNKKDKNIQ